jgi:hypothetical protein
MEKVIYALWRCDDENRSELNARLQEAAPALLGAPGVRGLRLNLQDEHVTRAEGLRQVIADPQPDAVVQLWLEASHGEFRQPVDTILEGAVGRIAAWLVTESTIIPNRKHPSVEAQRTKGWSQFCFLLRPEHLSREQWRYNWQRLHTRIAIDTQGNFEYVQNLVAHALIEGPLPYAALVEECFPVDAMDDAHVFFDAVDDEAKFIANTRAMAESCARFIAPGGVDLLPTSQYDFRKAFA